MKANKPKGMFKIKKEYVSPEIEIIEFEVEDIITASGLATGKGDNGVTPTEDWYS